MDVKSDDLACLNRLSRAEQAEFDRLLMDGFLWIPLPGPQSAAFSSTADVIGYGGAAGGGKSDLAIGLSLMKHRVSAIFRREATQLSGVIERMAQILGGRDGFNGSAKIWRLSGGRRIEFGSTPNLGDEVKYQGRPKDLLVLDEATNFLEHQARFLMGWVRSADIDQQCQTLMTFNPPTSAEGKWVLSFFGPWLQKGHPNPAKPGEIRWYGVIDGKDVEMDDNRQFVVVDGQIVHNFNEADFTPEQIITPQSRTFVPSSISDNPYLSGTGYLTQLQSLPEPLRSQMLLGDFSAGMEDDPWQVIPSCWVEAAQARWRPMNRKGPMDSIGADVSRGGRDETVIARRHGVWFDTLLGVPGTEAPDGPTVAGQIIAARRDRAPIHIDIVGWGASPYDFLVQNNAQTIGINGASKSYGVSAEGGVQFVNRRAEVWWRMREALSPANPNPISLPPDPRLLADLTQPRWSLTASGIKVEPKDDIIKRLGRSPDRGDAVCLAMIMTPKKDAAAAGALIYTASHKNRRDDY